MQARKSARSLMPSEARKLGYLLDDVSADIARLERYFRGSTLRIPLQVEFFDSWILPERESDLDCYAGPIQQVVETVAWEPLGGDSEWHLTYRKTRRLGILDPMGCDGPLFERSEDVAHCPLVDAPAVDRIRAHRALPDLVQEAGTLAR
jgi:hypothetical protein